MINIRSSEASEICFVSIINTYFHLTVSYITVSTVMFDYLLMVVLVGFSLCLNRAMQQHFRSLVFPVPSEHSAQTDQSFHANTTVNTVTLVVS